MHPALPLEPGPPPPSLRRHIRHLDWLTLGMLMSMVVMASGVNLFLFKQMRVARMQAGGMRSTVLNLSDQYQQKEPAMRRFVDALQLFGAAHPDFQPILQHYRGTLPQFFTGPSLVVSNMSMPMPMPMPTVPGSRR